MIRIFESILTPKLSNFEAEVKTMGKAMASATLAVNKAARAFSALERELAHAFATVDFQAIQMAER